MRRGGIGLLALPYGAATILVAAAWVAGGMAGTETTFGPRTGLALSLTLLAFAGWLATMILATRRMRLWALLAIPSAVLVGFTATGIPLLMGGCMLAKACI